MGNAERRLEEMGITLPVEKMRGTLPLRQVGSLIFMSGHGCELPEGGLSHEGKLGAELTVEEGYQAARHVGVNLLTALKTYLGDLDRVEKIIKVLGFVASTPDFHEQPAVMHGFSDLMVEIFGERGKHARSAIGTNVLPNNQPVEIEMIVQIRE